MRWRAAISPAPSSEFRAQYDVGADPVVVLSDLAEFVNFVTRVKIVPATADNVAFGETERVRAREFAAKLSMRVLSRMWQMLLKGITEVQTATRPAAAAEMVLVRIAYVADLPTPDEAIRMLEQNGGGSPVVSGGAAAVTRRAGFDRYPRCRPSPMRARFAAAPGCGGVRAAADGGACGRAAIRAGAADHQLSAARRARRREARSPDQGARWKPTCGWCASRTGGSKSRWSATRRAALVNDLSRKLEQWTGRRWTVIVSNEAGQPTLRSQNEQAQERARGAPPRPIRACRRCWRGFPAPRSSRCAGLPPSRRNPMLSAKTLPRVPTATTIDESRRTTPMADFLGMMKQAAQLQSKMQAMQEELGNVEVEGISGGGLVAVRMTAKMEVKGVKIDPSLMKADEREILEDLLVTAHNDARRKAETAMQEKMQALTGGLGLPPGLGLT